MAASRRLAAIMFTDLVGFTASAHADEARALALLREQETLVRPVLGSFGGREVKSTGDGLLVEFPSALKAVECAAEIQQRLRERNLAHPGAPIELRIGIHVGDVEARGDDIFGDSVNVASRVVPLADPGGVCLSEEVAAQVRNKLPYAVERLGTRSVKGVREPLAVYRVVLPWQRASLVPSSEGAPRLAVLPLANISPDPKDEYFADGLTEELIAVLSKIRGLRVVARTSVDPYKAAPKPLPQVGAELGVSSILSGSVRKAGDRIRVTLQLVDVASQEPSWTESYDRQLTDIFAIQSEVAESTAKAIRVELSAPDRASLRRAPTRDLEAYELYLRAIGRGERLSGTAFRESISLLEAALRRDPDFGLAHAQLAHVLVQGAGDWLPHHEAFPVAREHAARALDLAPDASETHAARANLAMQADRDWALAEAEYRRALALNPSDALAHLGYGGLLAVLGRMEEAEEEMLEAARLSPLWMPPRRWLSELALFQDDLDEGVAKTRTLIDPDPEPEATHLEIAMACAWRGRGEDARRELALAGPPSTPYYELGHAFVLAMLGEPEEGRRLIQEKERGEARSYLPLDMYAVLWLILGDRERALSTLEEAVASDESGIWMRYRAVMFDSIRADPRFLALLRKAGLPEDVVQRQALRKSPR